MQGTKEGQRGTRKRGSEKGGSYLVAAPIGAAMPQSEFVFLMRREGKSIAVVSIPPCTSFQALRRSQYCLGTGTAVALVVLYKSRTPPVPPPFPSPPRLPTTTAGSLLEGILDQNLAELCLCKGRAEDGQNPAHALL